MSSITTKNSLVYNDRCIPQSGNHFSRKEGISLPLTRMGFFGEYPMDAKRRHGLFNVPLNPEKDSDDAWGYVTLGGLRICHCRYDDITVSLHFSVHGVCLLYLDEGFSERPIKTGLGRSKMVDNHCCTFPMVQWSIKADPGRRYRIQLDHTNSGDMKDWVRYSYKRGYWASPLLYYTSEYSYRWRCERLSPLHWWILIKMITCTLPWVLKIAVCPVFQVWHSTQLPMKQFSDVCVCWPT